MVLPTVATGQKITAAAWNALVGVVNGFGSGFNPVIPTSVSGTGVTLGSGGKVTASGATSIQINGCFTSTYENYFLKCDTLGSGANLIAVKLSVAGTVTSTGYDTQVFSAGNATVAAAQSLNQASWFGTGTAATIQDFDLYLDRPQLASRETTALFLGRSTENPMTTAAGASYRVSQQRATTQFDGINFAPASGTLSGTWRVYGFNNN